MAMKDVKLLLLLFLFLLLLLLFVLSGLIRVVLPLVYCGCCFSFERFERELLSCAGTLQPHQ